LLSWLHAQRVGLSLPVAKLIISIRDFRGKIQSWIGMLSTLQTLYVNGNNFI
jgi:hypothetical protein